MSPEIFSPELVLKWFQAMSRLTWDVLSEFGSIVDSRNHFWQKDSWRHERHSKFSVLAYEAIFKPNLLQSEVVKGAQLLSKNCSEIVLKWFWAKSRLRWDLVVEFLWIVCGRNHFWRKYSSRHEWHSKIGLLAFEATFKQFLLQNETMTDFFGDGF